MSDLSEVAASVAKALGLALLKFSQGTEVYLDTEVSGEQNTIRKDGSNLTDPYWFKRCVGWIVEKGYTLTLDGLNLELAWEEYPARAIHELMRRES